MTVPRSMQGWLAREHAAEGVTVAGPGGEGPLPWSDSQGPQGL